MTVKGPAKGGRSKTLDDALLCVVSNFDLSKQQSAAIKSFASDKPFRIFAYRAEKISNLSACDSARKSVAKGLFLAVRPMLLVVSPLIVLIEDLIRSCEVFGFKCVKLEEFKDGDCVNLLFSSPESLEKHYECLPNVNEIFFGVAIDETHCVVTWWVLLFSTSCKSQIFKFELYVVYWFIVIVLDAQT